MHGLNLEFSRAAICSAHAELLRNSGARRFSFSVPTALGKPGFPPWLTHGLTLVYFMHEKSSVCLSVSGITAQALSSGGGGGGLGLGERVFHKNIIDEEELFIVMSSLN